MELQFQMKVGLLVNAVCRTISIALLKSYCLLVFNVDAVPDWIFEYAADARGNYHNYNNDCEQWDYLKASF